jgi:Flp pilus assembly protein TadD
MRKLGEVALQLGSFDEAAAALERARLLREQWQGDARLAADLAAAHRGAGRVERAEAILRASGLGETLE